MTWQRIDENTYVDDTLVTCVEYQLFIDEMREKGKYYQPDHWTSYQFPKGMAHYAILGVRYSDALEFCQWLTQREVAGWVYRLPIEREGKNEFLKQFRYDSPIGYWVRSEDKRYHFIWIGHVSDNPRGIAWDSLIRDYYTVGLLNSLVNNFDKPLDLDLIIISFRQLTEDISRARNIAHAYSNRRDKFNISLYDIDRTFSGAVEINLGMVSRRGPNPSMDFTFILHRIREIALYFDKIRTSNSASSMQRALGVYIDLLTLQERIAGRSPAFEGIRLVKERIK